MCCLTVKAGLGSSLAMRYLRNLSTLGILSFDTKSLLSYTLVDSDFVD